MIRADHILRSFGLSRRRPTAFDLRPDPATRDGLAAGLGLQALPELHFAGEIRPAGKADFELTARLRARAVQACVVTLEPVETVVDEVVARHYLADAPAPASGETEMPADVDSDPLPDMIDLLTVAAEALVLALPLYPRAPGAVLDAAAAAPAGTEAAPQTPAKPFAGLASLPRTPRADDDA